MIFTTVNIINDHQFWLSSQRVYLHYDIKNEDNSELEGEMNGNSTSLERLVSSLGEQYENVLYMYHKFKVNSFSKFYKEVEFYIFFSFFVVVGNLIVKS